MRQQYGLTAQGEALLKNNHSLCKWLPIHPQEHSGNPIPSDNVHELHSFLKVSSDTFAWELARILVYRFIGVWEYTDIETLSAPDSESSQVDLECVNQCLFTLQIAKELVIVEREDEGWWVCHGCIDYECCLSIVASEQQVAGWIHWLFQRDVTKGCCGHMCRAFLLARTYVGKDAVVELVQRNKWGDTQ